MLPRHSLTRLMIMPARSAAHTWASDSQLRARRNAMTACSTLAERRHERDEVQEYVASYLARHDGTTEVLTAR